MNKKISTPLAIAIITGLAVVLISGLAAGIFAWKYWRQGEKPREEKSEEFQKPEEKQEIVVISDEMFKEENGLYKVDFNFWQDGLAGEYQLGEAIFKIYPSPEDSFDEAYFEAFDRGNKIYTSSPIYAISSLSIIKYQNNKYIIVEDFSGGAHCCYSYYVFVLNSENELKLTKTFSPGEAGINPLLKNGKLYFAIGDDRFAYFHTSYASSYFFEQYYLADKDGLVLKNDDFKEEYLEKAGNCENELNEMLQGKNINYFEDWFPVLLCKIVNYGLAGEKEKGWKNFEEYFAKIKQISPDLTYSELSGKEISAEETKDEIIEIMPEIAET